MSSLSIHGRQVDWGLPPGVIVGIDSVITTGIIQSFSLSVGGATSLISDEDGDIVTRIDYGGENKLSMEITALVGSVIPVKGSPIIGLGTIDGINFNSGQVLVDDVKIDYANSAVKKFSINASHYPAMPADG